MSVGDVGVGMCTEGCASCISVGVGAKGKCLSILASGVDGDI